MFFKFRESIGKINVRGTNKGMKLRTKIRSRVMGFMASDFKRDSLRVLARTRRQLAGKRPHVLYFHQADDPYSHLVVQRFAELQDSYDLQWRPHLVSAPLQSFQGDASRFKDWALVDAMSVARDYGTQFPAQAQLPRTDVVAEANRQLAECIGSMTFAGQAEETGRKLWSGELKAGPDKVAEDANANDVTRGAIQKGNQLRRAKGHYLGAMFYFEGEWYWGLDRLYLLEERLRSLGFRKDSAEMCVPRPEAVSVNGLDASSVSLEYFLSLRSPYTAVGHQRVMDLVRRSGVKLILRPVMPMMMRGIPAPREKQLYIISDSKRESDAAGVRFGNFIDPFGEPVKRAFSLYPWVNRQGKAEAYVTAYLSAAWAEGIDICSDQGLRQVIESIGLSWEEALGQFDNDEWGPLLQDNVESMLTNNLWGVPSFRVSGGNGATSYACWGQDRIWRVESEITRRVTPL